MGIGPSTIDVNISHENKEEEIIHDKCHEIEDNFKSDQDDKSIDVSLTYLKKDFKILVKLINSIIIEEALIKELEIEYEKNPSEKLLKELDDFKDFNKNMKYIEDNIDNISCKENEISNKCNLLIDYLQKKKEELDIMNKKINDLNNEMELTINMLKESTTIDN